MTKAIRNLLFLMFFAALTAACGGSSGGGVTTGGGGDTPPPGDPPPPPVADVALEDLDGLWVGTFDRGADPTTGQPRIAVFELTIEGGSITFRLDGGAESDFTGPVTKATEAPRVFRFVLTNRNNAQEISRGALFVDPTHTYMAFLNDGFRFGVLQRDAAAPLPTWEANDLNETWIGDTFTTESVSTGPAGTGFGDFTQTRSNAACTAATANSSSCTGTVGDNSRSIPSIALDAPAFGRWGPADYSDTPPSATTQENGVTRIYLSPDKNFSGSWACTDFVGGFPATCDFSTRTKQ